MNRLNHLRDYVFTPSTKLSDVLGALNAIAVMVATPVLFWGVSGLLFQGLTQVAATVVLTTACNKVLLPGLYN